MSCISSEGSDLPAVDFSGENVKVGSSGWRKTCVDVREALEQYGSFMVVNYHKSKGDALGVCDEALAALKELFDLPLDTKLKNRYEFPLNGYVGQIPKLPLHESMGIENASESDAVAEFAALMWPHHGNTSFSEKVDRYVELASELDKTVTRMIFESYGIDQKHHDAYVESTRYLLRLLKNRAPVGNEPHLGFVSHTDKSFTTILHQNQVDGLEIDADNKIISVQFSSPASFVVVAGDALMVWSNNRIISPTHRVIMNGEIDRYSMGLFGFNKGMIQVRQEFVDEEHPLRYRPLDHLGLLWFFRSEEGYKSKYPVKAYCGI
ncbi:Probable 2-oxoglutarate-dependent dioxygenase AOP1 [Linum grandiflorum]